MAVLGVNITEISNQELGQYLGLVIESKSDSGLCFHEVHIERLNLYIFKVSFRSSHNQNRNLKSVLIRLL